MTGPSSIQGAQVIDGAELEAEAWIRDSGTWTGVFSSGVGPLSYLGPAHGGQTDDARFAYGSAPGRQLITVDFAGRLYQVPVSRYGVWAIIKTGTGPDTHGFPSPAS